MDVDACGEDDVEEPFFVELDDAACAMAAVPPISAPEMTRAANALVTRCRISLTSFPIGPRQLSERGSEFVGRELGVD
ncbi:MAG: hypothetical protein M3O84_03440 [Actinomycetota bacterium]|nr:hypothetical protein [Actinomycetota bacterium]